MFSLKISIERWKWNKEYGCYVSSLGNFKDKDKNPLPIKINQSGYVMVNPSNHYQFAHRMVMRTFKPTLNMESLTVDHLNHNKRDNSLDNLEWVTIEENHHREKDDFLFDGTLYAQHIEQFVDFFKRQNLFKGVKSNKIKSEVYRALVNDRKYGGYKLKLDAIYNNCIE